MTFHFSDIDFQPFTYKTYIRPLLEANTQLWSPYLLQDIDMVERVQRVFTRYLPGMNRLSYPERLEQLNLQSLEYRRIFFDLLLLFKIIHGVRKLLPVCTTRGHSFKIQMEHSRINSKKYFFTHRTTPIWNSLPEEIVSSATIEQFKNKLVLFDLKPYCRGRTTLA